MSTLKALEIWTAQTICDVGILLSVVSWFLALARPYFARTRDAMPLKIAADMWWMWYVVARDGALFVAFLAGLWTLNLDLMADIKIGLPFVPVGTVLMAVALALKVAAGLRDDSRLVTLTMGAAALLNLFGYVFIMEGPGREYAAAEHPAWQMLLGWRSNANPALSMWTFSVAMAALVVVGGITAIARRPSLTASAGARQPPKAHQPARAASN